VKVRDLGASVRQRLLNQARVRGRPFQELLQYFAMERFLYRLAKSPYADRFVLKGALLLTAWRAPLSRPTMDIDLEGRTSSDLERIRALVQAMCVLEVEPDGVAFDSDSMEVKQIKEDADYEGVRVRFWATLARARIRMQIDIGFGDAIVPYPTTVEYPTLLEFPPPVLVAYPRETVVAEKLEALTTRGLLNSRLKDYFDLWLLPRLYAFDGASLVAAIRATFQRRGVAVEALPVGLTSAFSTDPAKSAQWRAFLRRSRFTEAPTDLAELVKQIHDFATPPLFAAAVEGRTPPASWEPGGPWYTGESARG
jgi:hypothetical protein